MRRRRRLGGPIVVVGLVVLLALRCAGRAPDPDTSATPPTTPGRAGSTAATAPPALAARDPLDARSLLARLVIDDGIPPGGYLRDGWPTWEDIDHDGCDAREQALIAASRTPADRAPNCRVLSGSWVSAYDGVEVVGPPQGIEVDHLVPLKNAYVSGGDEWSVDRRVLFANDPSELWAVSSASNGSKGDRAPDDWRPPRRSTWCEYATRWVAIKVRWELTATTSERDALGEMLDTCAPGGAPTSTERAG